MALSNAQKNRRNYLRKKETGYYERRLARYKREMFAKLGDKCVRCGYDDPRALQIDHVNDDGYLERKQGKGLNTRQRHCKVLADTEGRYQTLCANCNWIKRAEQLNRERVSE